MVELNFQADPDVVVEERDFPLLADGEYKAMITDASVKQSQRNEANKYLSVECSFEDNNGRVWKNLNLWNQNDEAVRIANEQMNNLCLAVGLMNLTDTEQLIGQRVLVDIYTQPAKDNYKASNQIRTFKKIGKPAQLSQTVTTHTEAAVPTPTPIDSTKPQTKNAWDL